jgi:hypothetical protein
MKTTIDVTDDASPGAPSDLPDPCTICMEGEDITICMCGVDIRMTVPQLIAMTEAQTRWMFRDFHGHINANDPTWCAHMEHQKLRRIIKDLLNGLVAGHVVPEEIRGAVGYELARVDIQFNAWVEQRDALEIVSAKVCSLQQELAELRKRSRKGPKL